MTSTVPELLERLRGGDQSVMNELVAALYGELHRIAACHLRGERPEHTLQPTALVHEAYMRLFSDARRQFADRVHFLSVASRVMRQVLVDYARARSTQKRGGEWGHEALQGEWAANVAVEGEAGVKPLDLLELDRALEALAGEDQALAQLIEMRYFAGMTAEEVAEALGQSVHVVRHDLRFAHAWLRRNLSR